MNSAFNGASAEFFRNNYERSVRGHVRYELTHHHLAGYVIGRHLEVADIGGGSGPDAVWLASLGHRVTLVEPAEDHLEMARERIASHPPAVQKNIVLRQGVADDLIADKRQFDLVMSHGVAMYLRDYSDFIEQLVALTRKGGIISLLEKGYAAKKDSLLKRASPEEFKYFQETGGWVEKNNTGKPAYAFKPEELEALLAKAGAHVIEWSGVRTFSNDIDQRVDGMDKTELEKIIDREITAARDPRIRSRAQMLHFIARKD